MTPLTTKRKTRTTTRTTTPTRTKKTTTEHKVADPKSQAVIAAVNKKYARKFGQTAALRLRDVSVLGAIPGGVSTQSLAIDLAIGRPGIPLGRITEISGLESDGKSTLAAHLLAEAQRRGGTAILVDKESGFEVEHAADMGIDLDKLIVLQPPHLESLFEMVTAACDALPESSAEAPIVVVWDSVASTPAQAEVEGEFDERFVGIHARIIGHGLRKLVAYIAKRKIAFVCVNQLREKIDRMAFGEDKYQTFGGHALRFACSVRLMIRRVKTDKKVGIHCKVKVIKNKVGMPFNEAHVLIRFDRGLDRVHDIAETAVEYGVIQEGHGTYSFGKSSCRKGKFASTLAKEMGGLGAVRKMIVKKALEQKVYRPY